ncbi:Holliday junction branch migration protein RuvA [Candidatus Uhrbacteria bacterium]|nr:Holliday junction branch migration protein RuvA [Candidatus Uhrbacteria bacterium]
MIITLSGTVTAKDGHDAIVEVEGVGYQVHLHKRALEAVAIDAPARLWTHEYIREDSRDLYGFLNAAEHRLFLKLLSISGVGPKLAMNIFSLGGTKEIESMIDRGDIAALTGVSGVGRKTAQKIVLELRGRLADDRGDAETEEMIAALVNLGYGRERSREVLASSAGDKVEDRLRTALKELSKK